MISLQMAKDRANITIAIKYEVRLSYIGFQLAYLLLTLILLKVKVEVEHI